MEFSDAPYDRKYDIRSNGQEYDKTEEFNSRKFGLLDAVRLNIINGIGFDRESYRQYLDMVLKNIPADYQRFYTDLSVDV